MRAKTRTVYTVECLGPNGRLKWLDGFENIVVTEGLNLLLDNTFTAPAGAVTWYVGLKGTGTVNAGDTLASHAGWLEINPYTGNRPAYVPDGAAAAGVVTNTAVKASYTITTGTTVYGAFMADVDTGTSGALYGAGDFAIARVVAPGDTLRVRIDAIVA